MSFTFVMGGLLFATAVIIGVIASYKNIRHSRGPKERAYVWRMCSMSWGVVLSLLLLAYVVRPPALYAVLAAYVVGTPFLFYRWTHRHQLVRELERREGEAAK